MRKVLANWWALSALAAVLAALLLTVGLPLVVAPLRTLWVRGLCLVAVAAGWGVLAWLRARRAKAASAAIAAALARPDATVDVAGDESGLLAARMTEAMATLKTTAGRGRDYLYARPWYVIIGPPGAGKTTALRHSGLRFPAGDQALKGLGGTRSLDFWFADEAAMIDTAGRYTSQDSDATADAGAWASFLALLKRHRPRQPINGVIVAIGMDELIGADVGIDRHAAAVRSRLAEVKRALAVDAPVYVILTKADLLAGFTEYFDDLDPEGRRAVLGATLPWQEQADVAGAFDDMAGAITDRQPARLLAETDMQRRALLLGFPAQVGALRPGLLRFLDGAFGDGAALRGFYLTSGTQEGTPLDRLLSGTAEVYDRPQHVAAGTQGRAYFLNRLLTEVMVAEAGLVQHDPAASARRRRRLVGGITAVAAACVVALVGWGVSFAANRSFQQRALAGADAARQAVKRADLDLREVRATDPDLRAALPVLDATRDLPQGDADRRAGGPPLTMRLGLYQAGLADEAAASYRAALRRVMLPRLLLRLEQVMASDPRRARPALDAYLMLGSRRPLDPGAVTAFVTADWANEVYPGPRAAADRRSLAGHLAALLDDPDLASVWPGRRAPLNGPLVAMVMSGGVRPTRPPAAPAPAAVTGPLGPVYAQDILPACRSVAQGHYPFFGASADDAPLAEAQRLFGTGGKMEGFILQRAMPAMDTGGPIWRWRADDAAAAALDPQSPEELSKAMQIRDLLVGGLPLKASVAALGADVASVDIATGGNTDSFARDERVTKPLAWTAAGAPGAEVVLRGANGVELNRFRSEGPWALFRLMDQATRENAGRQSFRASFGDGNRSATFLVELPSERNPFSRGGLWSFRCPVAL